MKNLILLSIIILNYGCSAYGQIMKADKYDTSYKDVYLVSIDSVSGWATIKPIVIMYVDETKEVPCSIIYYWAGENKDSVGLYISGGSEKYDSTKNYGPCGFIGGFFTAYSSKYKGDSVIDTNCKALSFATIKTLYFIPDKKKKHKLGTQYELQKGDYIGEMDKWIKYNIISCG